MTDQHTPGWIEWKGGECPVAYDVWVDVAFRRSPDMWSSLLARHVRWIDYGPADDFAVVTYRLSDRLADEVSDEIGQLKSPEPCFECGSTERIGTACKPCNPELDPSAVAGAIERLDGLSRKFGDRGYFTVAGADLRALIADHAQARFERGDAFEHINSWKAKADAQALRIKALEIELEDMSENYGNAEGELKLAEAELEELRSDLDAALQAQGEKTP